MNKKNPMTWHFALFIILSIIGIAQLSWWVIFQVQEGDRSVQKQMLLWSQQIKVARLQVDISDADSSGQDQMLKRSFPDLEFSDDLSDIVVTDEALNRLDRIAQKHVRMFVSEAAFFSLLVLAGIWFLYWALQKRVEIEQRTAGILSSVETELKEPLASLKQVVGDLTNQEMPNERYVKLLEKMTDSVQKVSQAIDNISMVKLISASKRRISLKMADISEAANKVLDKSFDILNKSDFPIETNIQPGLLAAINLERWELIVQSLIENAMQFSQGEKKLEINLLRHHNIACFEVKRFGIDSKKYAELSESSFELKFNIIREMIEAIGGSFSITELKEKNGIVFTVRLNLLDEVGN